VIGGPHSRFKGNVYRDDADHSPCPLCGGRDRGQRTHTAYQYLLAAAPPQLLPDELSAFVVALEHFWEENVHDMQDGYHARIVELLNNEPAVWWLYFDEEAVLNRDGEHWELLYGMLPEYPDGPQSLAALQQEWLDILRELA